MTDDEVERWKEHARFAANDLGQVEARYRLAQFTAQTFSTVGTELHAAGYILGGDRAKSVSTTGHGSDEVVAVSLLLRIAGQLVSASTDLFSDGRNYAAAALLRQLVEIEYLAWAFDAREKDAERWLRSTAKERQDFFKPVKLRLAAQGKFRGKDYGYHCEMGGHPAPQAANLLNGDTLIAQLLLADLLGHTGRIWNHLLAWSASQPWASSIDDRKDEVAAKYSAWQRTDRLVDLSPPP